MSVRFRKKPVIIEAYTFDEMIAYGLNNTDNIIGTMPWLFNINGHIISHETDSSYIIETLEGDHRMTTEDMLIIGVKGEIYPCKLDIFEMTYERVDDV